MGRSRPKRVFISYARRDWQALDQVKIMLTGALLGSGVEIWDDSKIQGSSDWRIEIDDALSGAQVAILIVTGNFLASDFIMNKELPMLLAKKKQGRLKVTWICWSASSYEHTDIDKLQALHDRGKPLNAIRRPTRDAILSKAAAQVAEMF